MRSKAERQIASGLRTGWVALATFLGLIALSAALVVAFEHAIGVADDLNREDERQLVRRLLDRTMEGDVSAQLGLLNWNEAVVRVAAAPRNARAMAWVDHEFGAYAWQAFATQQALLVRRDGSVMRGWIRGAPVAESRFQGLRSTVTKLLARSQASGMVLGTPVGQIRADDGSSWPVDRAGMPLPRWAGGLVRMNGQVMIITVGSIVPDHVPDAMLHTPVYFATLRPFDDAQSARMRRDLVLGDLGLTLAAKPAAADNAIALDSVDGTRLGWLHWTARSPGPAIVRSAEPMLWAWTLLFVGVLVGGSVVLRRTWRTTRELLASEAQARHNALHDAMSGLPNRVHYMQRLRQDLAACITGQQRGRARFRRFTRDMDASVKLRLELEMELRRAIARDELSVAYQPIVTAGRGEIVGVEALLRWQHPERGAIRPDLFVPIAEQGGLMIVLGNWMLRRVFAQCRDWPSCDISVNLSPIQIMAGNFLPTMAAIVAETGIDPARIVLEITEGVMLDRSDHVLGVLRELNRMGFRVALDDFGNGYSSLSYLRLFQFERIKIDRSFVSNIESDADANAILCTIAALGHSLRMKVVAEGVENETQRQLVQAAGCELVQGYLFWKPMPAEDMRPLLGRPAGGRLLRLA